MPDINFDAFIYNKDKVQVIKISQRVSHTLDFPVKYEKQALLDNTIIAMGSF